MSQDKKEKPNWGGNTFGTGGVGTLTPASKDDELKYKIKNLKVSAEAPEPEASPGGPEVKKTVDKEPRSSVTG